MTKTELQKIAKDVFAQAANDGLSEIHITSDGTAFGIKNDANNHAFKQEDKAVVTIKRDGTEEEEATEDSQELKDAKLAVTAAEGKLAAAKSADEKKVAGQELAAAKKALKDIKK